MRRGARIFDLSHMGEVGVTGRRTSWTTPCVGVLSRHRRGPGQVLGDVDEDGRVLDDLITYRLGEDRYLVVPTPAARHGGRGAAAAAGWTTRGSRARALSVP
ncbi:hypothetical protein QJS66_20285 [Kocuria rhizophila]|nr:hypothetical protein QJS66_20285 [Kocuria rhizophila]